MELAVRSQLNPTPSGTGSHVSANALKDGTLVGASYPFQLAVRGLVYTFNVGAFSTPIVGGGNGTVLDLDQPEFIISVASGAACLPLRIDVQTQQPLTAADNDESEILIMVDRTQAWAGDGTATTPTLYNYRTNVANPSGATTGSITVRTAFTVDTTDPVESFDLARSVNVADVQGTAANVVVNNHRLLYEPGTPPIIVGPAMICGYWGGTVATSGFAQVVFADISGLTNLWSA